MGTLNVVLILYFCTINVQLTYNKQRFREFRKFLETLNGGLPLKHSSDRPQTLPKRVSDDSQHFIFRRRKNLSGPKKKFSVTHRF